MLSSIIISLSPPPPPQRPVVARVSVWTPLGHFTAHATLASLDEGVNLETSVLKLHPLAPQVCVCVHDVVRQCKRTC